MSKTKRVTDTQILEVFPDNTIFYDIDSANTQLQSIEKKRYTISDLIMLLLYSQKENPVYGKLVFMKEIFLLNKEVLNENEVQDTKYVPYRYGMYSFTVSNAILNLEYSGFIKRMGKKNSKLEQFSLTEVGKKHISLKFTSLPTSLQDEIKDKRKGWDQLGYKGILRLVYNKYPEYIDKSEIKEKYKKINWGRGKG